MGPGPASSDFDSGINDGSWFDNRWKIAATIDGPYTQASIMRDLPDNYFNSVYWISFSATGEHTLDKNFFFKTEVNLPCTNPCGKSFNDPGTFCLNLDLYADNSIFEIYVNGVPQSSFFGTFPLPDPYNPPDHTQSTKTAVSLCNNWKAGNNILIIEIASSATVAGLMVTSTVNPPPPPGTDTIPASICEGASYAFADQQLTTSGYYYHSFPRSSGCDSNVVINLDVKPKARTTIEQTICEGESYLGHSTSGTYTETFVAANGCDSLQILELTVNPKPAPDLGPNSGLCPGDSLVLNPGTFSSYLWQDGSSLDHFVVKQPGQYSVTVSNACGTKADQLLVSNGVCDFFFPTAFTPNQDGKNDLFRILTDYHVSAFRLLVFNRWGQVIFESTDPSKGWNGNYQGQLQPAATYVWNCTFVRDGKKHQLKGTVTLIR